MIAQPASGAGRPGLGSSGRFLGSPFLGRDPHPEVAAGLSSSNHRTHPRAWTFNPHNTLPRAISRGLLLAPIGVK